MKALTFFFLAFCPLAISTAAFADPIADAADAPTVQRCSAQATSCFASTGANRSSCLYEASQAAACRGSELGDLVYKRWALSPAYPEGNEPPPAFLGPQLIDQECLANFDAQLSSALVKGDITNEQLAQLNQRLDACQRELATELSRP